MEPEEAKLTETTPFKALRSGNSYQAGEKEQYPAAKFPSTLASYALVFETDDEWKTELETGFVDQATPSFAKLNAQPLLDKLRSSDMIVRELMSEEKDFMFALVSISEKRQKQVAEIMSLSEHNLIRMRMKSEDDEGNEVKQGGAWFPFKQHMAHLYERSTEDTLFSSRQQCQIIEFLLNGDDERAMGPQLVQREACEPGLTPLEQLEKDERIVKSFYLHHRRKKEWMVANWCSSYFTKQPHEDIREYLGEEIGLMFVFIGYLLTSMWVPAITGIFVLFMEITAVAETGGETSDNPYMPLFAIFMAVWAIYFRAGWQQLEMTYQLDWGIQEWEEEEEDRHAFINNNKTYKRLNRITQSEEYYPDPIWRNLFLVVSFLVTVAMIAGSIFVHISIEATKSGIAQLVGWGADAVLPKVISCIFQASSILVLRWLADIVFTTLCDLENWQKESEYQAAMISKKFCFGFVNSYFPIYFVGFMANHIRPFGVDVSCHEGRCLDYMTMMIAIIYIQNVLTRYFLIYAWPSIMDWWENRDGSSVQPQAETNDEPMEEGEDEANETKIVLREKDLDEFEGADDQYTEKFFHLGYVMLFGAAFPLLTFLSLLNNLMDLRSLASALMTLYKRPTYKCANDIGSWMTILDIFVIMSIVSQCCFLAFTSNGLYYYFPDMNNVQKTFYAVVIEHILLLLKVMVDSSYAELPAAVTEEFERRDKERDELVAEYDKFNPEEDVIFYTDDDGHVELGAKHSDGKDKK